MPNYPLRPCFSKCGLWTRRISITWVLVRNAEPRASSQICCFRIYILTRSLPEIYASQSVRSTVLALAYFLFEPLPYSKRCNCSWISNIVRGTLIFVITALSWDFQMCSGGLHVVLIKQCQDQNNCPRAADIQPLQSAHSTNSLPIPLMALDTQLHSALKNYAFYSNNLLLIMYNLVLFC